MKLCFRIIASDHFEEGIKNGEIPVETLIKVLRSVGHPIVLPIPAVGHPIADFSTKFRFMTISENPNQNFPEFLENFNLENLNLD